MFNFLSSILLLALLSSCAHDGTSSTSPNKSFDISPRQLVTLLPQMTQIVQLVQFHKAGQEDRTVQVIIHNAQELSINVLSIEGIELLSLKINEKKIEKTMLQKDFALLFEKYIFPDIFFTYVSTVELAKKRLDNIKLVDTPGQRLVYEHEQPLMKVSFSNIKDRFASDLSIDNYKFDYRVEIKMISLEKL